MTREERNIRERDRLRAKRALLPKPTVEERRAKRVEAARKKREYNRDRMRKIRAEEAALVGEILKL